MNDFTSPAIQAMNLIRHIGNAVLELGEQCPGEECQVET